MLPITKDNPPIGSVLKSSMQYILYGECIAHVSCVWWSSYPCIISISTSCPITCGRHVCGGKMSVEGFILVSVNYFLSVPILRNKTI